MVLLFVTQNCWKCSSFTIVRNAPSNNRNRSVPRASRRLMKVTSIRVDEPVIVCIDDIIQKSTVQDIVHSIHVGIQNQTLTPTKSYQENIFASDVFEKEDETLATIIKPFIESNLIPIKYQTSKLESFVYAVTKFQYKLDEMDIITGANIIQRRQAFERWKSDEGQALMDLVSDSQGCGNANVFNIGSRYQLPIELLREIKTCIPRILKEEWIIKDATIVIYQEGQTQVPHIDPCDATIIICLQKCDIGGETCFPLIGEKINHDVGNGLLFFSKSSRESQSIASLHHGGLVDKGEKMIVQIMLEKKSKSHDPAISWVEFLNLQCLDLSKIQ